MLTFRRLSTAKSFLRGFCVPRCVVLVPKYAAHLYDGNRWAVCSASTAKRRGLQIVSKNFN